MTKKKNNKSKSIKKEVTKKIEKVGSSVEREWLKVLKIVVGVLVFLSVFYLLTIAIVSDENSDNVEKVETSIQYEEILAGSSFTMRDSEYLVVYYDFTDAELSDLSSAIYSYSTSYSDDVLRVYTVDMSNRFNSEYIAEEKSNKTPETAADLLIDGPTLIKFSDGKVEKYIEGLDSVLDYLS